MLRIVNQCTSEVWRGKGHTVNIGVEGMDPLLFRYVQYTLLLHLICMVVEQYVDSTHLAQGLVNHFLAVFLSLEICGIEVTFLSLRFDIALRLLCVFFLVWQVGDKAVRAFHCKQDSCGLADTRVTTGDECLLAFQLLGCFV